MPIKFQKKCSRNEKVKNFKKELPGEVFNSTGLPSGNLVDGLPLDLHYGCNEVLLGSKARALKYFFLPCDPGWMIESSPKHKVYHSKSKFICMNEMCDDIKSRAP